MSWVSRRGIFRRSWVGKAPRRFVHDVFTGITGTATPSLPSMTVVSAGTVTVTGSATPSLPSMTLAAAGTVAVAGAATPSLPAISLAAAGTVLVNGVATPTLPSMTIVSAGTVADLTGIATPTLPSMTIVSAGTILVNGTATPSLPAIALSASGTVGGAGAPVSGDAAITLPALLLTARGGVNINVVSIYSIAGQTGADTGATVAISRDHESFLNRDVLQQTVLGAGSATILIEGSLDGGSSWDTLKSSASASEMTSIKLPPMIRVRLSAATAADVDVYLDADQAAVRVDN